MSSSKEVDTNFIKYALHGKSMRRQSVGSGQGGMVMYARCGGHNIDLIVAGPPIKHESDDDENSVIDRGRINANIRLYLRPASRVAISLSGSPDWRAGHGSDDIYGWRSPLFEKTMAQKM